MKKIVLGLIISAVFLFIVFRKTNFNDLVTAFRQVNYLIVVAAIFFHGIGFWLRTLRWKLLLLRLKRVRVRHLFPYLAMGYMANNVLILKLGEVVRAVVIGRQENLSKSSMLAVILTERLFDVFALVLFFGGLILFLPLPPDLKNPLLWVTILFIGALVTFFLLPFVEKINVVKSVFNFIEEKPKLNRPYKIFISFLDGLKTLKGFRSVVQVLTLSLLIWMVEAGMFWLIGLSFPVGLGIGQAAILALAAGLSTLIPAGPGNLGAFEGVFVMVATYFGVNYNLAVSFAFLTHFSQWLPITVIGFYYGWKKGISPLSMTGDKQ